MPKGGSINPQGIKKGSALRNALVLSPGWNGYERMSLDNGDFDGYEAAIAATVYDDKDLYADLLSGKKIHGLWGSAIYKISYDEIMKTEDIPETEPDGYYRRSKRSFFLKMYDGQIKLMSEVLQLPEEETYQGQKYFEEKYPGVAKAKEKIYKQFEAMRQEELGSPISWHEPKEYVESFLGFKRYFTLEFSIVKALYDLAQNPTKEMKALKIKVRRREDRVQTASGALQTAVYAAAFSIQSSVVRAAVNHVIQSPGGEMTKLLQRRIWDLQPTGINPWKVMPFNVHDEIECPVVNSLQPELKRTVEEFIEEYKKYVPLLSMSWKQNIKSWGDK